MPDRRAPARRIDDALKRIGQERYAAWWRSQQGDLEARRKAGAEHVLSGAGMVERYAYRLDTTVDAVDRGAWDDLCASADADVMMTRPFLRVVEEEHIFGSQQLYLVLSDPITTQAIAAAVFTILPVDMAALAGHALRQTVTTLRRVAPSFLEFPVALCGLPVSLGQSSLLIRPGADDARALAALDTLLRGTALQAGTALMAYKEFAPQDATRLDRLRASGYQHVPTLPTYIFPPQFRDFEAYVHALRAPYRNSIRHSQQKLRDAGVTIDRLDDPEQIASWYTAETHQLYLGVVARAEYQFEVLSATFFRALARAFPGELTFAVARTAAGEVIGYLCSLQAQGRFHGLYMGLDSRWNARCDLYFNLMYADLDYALRQGARRIELGQTADVFKARLGCQQEPRSLCIQARGRILPGVLRWGLPLLTPSPETLPVFHVFPA
jgi:predicted N-acyltransferase